MRQLIILGFLFLAIDLSAQYTPLHLDIGTYWKVDAYNSLGGLPNWIETKSESIGDTSINNLYYYKIRTIKTGIFLGLVHYPVDYFTYLRNDTMNKKVYAFINGNDSLIYNFNLSIGDSLKSTIGNGWGPDVIIDTIYYANYFGTSRKVFATKDTFGNIQRKLIEGLGSEFGFIAYSYDHGFENGAITKCIKFNGTTLYGDSSISCDLPLGISSVQKSLNVSVYPNPTRNKIIIVFDKNYYGNNTTEIKTLSGNRIIKVDSKFASESIDISDLASGIYLLTITNSDRSYTQRIIKE